MEKPFSVAVVILTYNPNYDSLRQSLNSVITQVGIDFEIVITDDGSKEDIFEWLEGYFNTVQFRNYKIVLHEHNQGTVKNYLDGVEVTNAKYIRGLGQGDMLYDNNVLLDSYEYIEKKQALVSISQAVFFSAVQGKIKLISESRNPQNIDAYSDLETLKKYYLLYGDKVSGSTMFTQRECILQYLEKIKNRVIYTDDMIVRLMVFDECKIVFHPKNTIWYEHGTGVSTTTNLIWIDRINKDWNAATDILLEKCKECKNKEFVKFYDKRTTAHRRFRDNMTKFNHIKYYLSVPGFLSFRVKSAIYSQKTDINVKTDFLMYCINLKNDGGIWIK